MITCRSVLLVAAIALSVGCRDDGPDAADAEAIESLPTDALVASCITDEPDGSGPGTADLCTVTMTGAVKVVREGVDLGGHVALSRDRTRVVYSDGGELRVVGVDGSTDLRTGVEGSRPAWVSEDRVAFLRTDHSAIGVMELEDGEEADLLTNLELPPTHAAATIDGFAIDPATGSLAVSLWHDTEPVGEFGGDDRSSLLAFTVDSQGTPDPATMRIVIDRVAEAVAQPALSGTGLLAVIIDNDLHIGPLADFSGSRLASPDQFVATTPTWSPEGNGIAWLAEGVGRDDGPTVLVYAHVDRETGATDGPYPIRASNGEPFDQFPVLPNW